VTLSGSWGRETQDITAGALFVPIAQASARLVMHLLEPQAPDRLPRGVLQRVLRAEGIPGAVRRGTDRRTVLAQHPQLQDEFSRKLEEDPAFAASPAAGWNSSCAITHHGTLMRISIRYSVWMSCWLRRARRGANRSCKFKSADAASRCGGSRRVGAAWCQTPESQTDERTAAAVRLPRTTITACIRISATSRHRCIGPRDWAWFGGALVAIGAAHHYDTQVRTISSRPWCLEGELQGRAGRDSDRGGVRGDLGYATLIGDTNARGGVDHAGSRRLGGVTAIALKYAVAARDLIDQQPNSGARAAETRFRRSIRPPPSRWAQCSRSQATTTIGGCGASSVMAWAPPPATSASSTTPTGSPTPSRSGARNRKRALRMNRRDRTDDGTSLRVVPVERGAMLTTTCLCLKWRHDAALAAGRSRVARP